MFDNAFTSEALTEALDILKNDFPLAIWETIYVTLLSTLFAIIIGLPLGVLLVAGEKGGVLPLPKALMKVLNVIINLLRSVPFLILMILVFPLTRLIVGTAVGTAALAVGPVGSTMTPLTVQSSSPRWPSCTVKLTLWPLTLRPSGAK